MSDLYEKVLGEVRKDWGTRSAATVDWERVDKALFMRIAEERRKTQTRTLRTSSLTLRSFAAAAFAAALAVVAVGWDRGRDVLPDAAVQKEADEIAGVIVAAEGRVTVNDGVVARGSALHLGDVIEADLRVTIERAGRVTLTLEPDSTARITHVHGSLVLALAAGAIEANVVRVPSGESFAVDVERTRIAVHGTHLRVARTGTVAVVDLTEGVVAIGPAPRVGAVQGALMVAPAHAEFAVADPQNTLSVTHSSAAVRAPIPLAPARATIPGQTSVPPPGKVEFGPVRPQPAFGGGVRADLRPASSAASVAPSDADTTASITNAVRGCMGGRPSAENVTVAVTTTLHVALQPDGTVRSARFEPPVAPDVNECAASTIYKAKFNRNGPVDIAVSYVSQ